jgi:hypothetical protein
MDRERVKVRVEEAVNGPPSVGKGIKPEIANLELTSKALYVCNCEALVAVKII